MNIEIWSDVACPWCYIGKRRLEGALRVFEHSSEVTVTWHSFELDPAAPAAVVGEPVARLAAKYHVSRTDAEAMQARMTAAAAGEGLQFHLEQVRSGNTYHAHRLLHLAREAGRQDQLKERLLAAYFTEGAAVGDRDALLGLAVEAGLDAEAAREVLQGDAFGTAVRDDEREAARLGINGVPFFVIDRTYGISGAQPSDVIVGALRTAWTESHPLQMVGVPGGPAAACADGSCTAP